jgi:hypothetical protein
MPSWNEFAKELITKPAEQPTKIGSVDWYYNIYSVQHMAIFVMNLMSMVIQQ